VYSTVDGMGIIVEEGEAVCNTFIVCVDHPACIPTTEDTPIVSVHDESDDGEDFTYSLIIPFRPNRLTLATGKEGVLWSGKRSNRGKRQNSILYKTMHPILKLDDHGYTSKKKPSFQQQKLGFEMKNNYSFDNE
jgi:hypothetical protein